MDPASKLSAACGALLLALAAPAAAHDFWIQPSSFRPATDERVELALYFGESWSGEEVPRNPERILAFRAFDAAGMHDVVGVDMKSPAGFLRQREPGVVLVAYHCTPNSITLSPEKFEPYLKEEGLERVIEARRDAGESASPARELYQRCAKSLLVVGAGGPAAGWERRAGLPLELIPLADPHALGSARTLSLELSFQSAPLEGALVVAFERSKPAELRAQGRTDAQGRAQLVLPADPGRAAGSAEQWLVKSVHMQRAADRSKADWESWWASLTFETATPASEPATVERR